MSNPYTAPNNSMGQAAQTTFEPEIFALRGRLGRVRYLAYSFVINIVILLLGSVIIGVVVAIIRPHNPRVLSTLGSFLYVPILAPILAFTIILAKRRLNDLGQSGWLSLLLIVP